MARIRKAICCHHTCQQHPGLLAELFNCSSALSPSSSMHGQRKGSQLDAGTFLHVALCSPLQESLQCVASMKNNRKLGFFLRRKKIQRELLDSSVHRKFHNFWYSLQMRAILAEFSMEAKLLALTTSMASAKPKYCRSIFLKEEPVVTLQD